MGRTYTDFSQLSKGMFKKSDPVMVSRKGSMRQLPSKKATFIHSNGSVKVIVNENGTVVMAMPQ